MKPVRRWKLVLGSLLALAPLVVAGCGSNPKHPAEAPEPAGEGYPQQQQAPAAQPYSEQESADEAAPAAGAPMPGSMRTESAEDAGQRPIEALSQDLDRALSLSTPDCPTAHLLRDQICDLSRRICGLSDESRQDRELVERCGDARARCQRAVDRTQATCP